MSIAPERIEIHGLPARLLHSRGEETPVVFIHGGIPGITPYCSGLHIWGDILSSFAERRPVIAPDLPGSGETSLAEGALPSIDGAGQHLFALLRHFKVEACHLVGHDEGGLVALWAALEKPEIVRSVSIVASAAAAPTGDAVQNITFAYPPAPLWGRIAQSWAIDRISYKHDHIDGALIDACVRVAETPGHERLRLAMGKGGYYGTYMKSVGKAKARFYEACRGRGFPVPAQILWGSHDPLTEPGRGLGLFRDIAPRQGLTTLQLINRTGNLIFREQPQEFFRVVTAFQQAVEAKR